VYGSTCWILIHAQRSGPRDVTTTRMFRPEHYVIGSLSTAWTMARKLRSAQAPQIVHKTWCRIADRLFNFSDKHVPADAHCQSCQDDLLELGAHHCPSRPRPIRFRRWAQVEIRGSAALWPGSQNSAEAPDEESDGKYRTVTQYSVKAPFCSQCPSSMHISWPASVSPSNSLTNNALSCLLPSCGPQP